MTGRLSSESPFVRIAESSSRFEIYFPLSLESSFLGRSKNFVSRGASTYHNSSFISGTFLLFSFKESRLVTTIKFSTYSKNG